MNFSRLEKNIADNVLEAQIKLGYEKRAISLNYTLSSINHLTEQNLSQNEMAECLKDFSPNFCRIQYVPIKNGFCFTVSAEGAEYVHEHSENTQFITDFINAVRNHANINEVLDVFRKYGDITVKSVQDEEFDYLVYFNDGFPDDYFYCLTDEGVHVSYHRFIQQDFLDLGFEVN